MAAEGSASGQRLLLPLPFLYKGQERWGPGACLGKQEVAQPQPLPGLTLWPVSQASQPGRDPAVTAPPQEERPVTYGLPPKGLVCVGGPARGEPTQGQLQSWWLVAGLASCL